MGIAMLFAVDCKSRDFSQSGRHLRGITVPRAEGIGSGMTVGDGGKSVAARVEDDADRDIERALAGAELEEETRPLAFEARAHVIVQRAIDEMHRKGTLPRPTSVKFLCWVHKDFYDEMPDEFRVIEHPDGTQELTCSPETSAI